jgi:hypothetical protein
MSGESNRRLAMNGRSRCHSRLRHGYPTERRGRVHAGCDRTLGHIQKLPGQPAFLRRIAKSASAKATILCKRRVD